ncbi:MAG: HD-GYP domain-containing protein [Firmicutes bacterium]|jgi:HD-GYP domain-containing protein (c-di-GMP phosphodiesterase class II)|nr:HD-GYP domain-containing protein [Bacillota bacterium]
MRAPTRAARFYVYTVTIIGLAVLVRFPPTKEPGQWAAILSFTVLTFLTEAFPVNLPRENGTVSVGFAVVNAAILLFGPEAAQWVAAIGTIRAKDLMGKTPLLAVLFNRAMLSLAAFSAGKVYVMLGGVPGATGRVPVMPLIVCALTYTVINTSLIVGVVSIDEGVDPRGLWGINFRWAMPNMLALVPIAVVLAQVYYSAGIPGAMVFLVPLLLARYSFKRYIDLRDTYLETVKALTATLDAKDPCTRGHSERVAQIAVETGRMLGLNEEDIELLGYVGMLHDVGKIGIRDSVLKKPGKFTREEYAEMKMHSRLGADIISHVRLLGPGAQWVKHHHERYDGQGFPDRLRGEEIPIGARIIAAADAFDAMTSERPYKRAYTLDEARTEMLTHAGTQFDPRVVEALLAAVDKLEGRESTGKRTGR